MKAGTSLNALIQEKQTATFEVGCTSRALRERTYSKMVGGYEFDMLASLEHVSAEEKESAENKIALVTLNGTNDRLSIMAFKASVV